MRLGHSHMHERMSTVDTFLTQLCLWVNFYLTIWEYIRSELGRGYDLHLIPVTCSKSSIQPEFERISNNRPLLIVNDQKWTLFEAVVFPFIWTTWNYANESNISPNIYLHQSLLFASDICTLKVFYYIIMKRSIWCIPCFVIWLFLSWIVVYKLTFQLPPIARYTKGFNFSCWLCRQQLSLRTVN